MGEWERVIKKRLNKKSEKTKPMFGVLWKFSRNLAALKHSEEKAGDQKFPRLFHFLKNCRGTTANWGAIAEAVAACQVLGYRWKGNLNNSFVFFNNF